MSANPGVGRLAVDPFAEGEESSEHAPEPWTQDGRYIRDANGAIVVRGRNDGDARRIAAAINGVRGIPTAALEGWSVHDVSDPDTRPDLEIDFAEELAPSASQVHPPEGSMSEGVPEPAWAPPEPRPFDRRVFERRQSDRRRSPDPGS
jgi:hypothetical protein